ncbi:MAG: S8 family peptidase [Armatimonadota bacterium]|nr:S8 family peptidase [Armatimonadota bacterium]
MRRGLLVVCTVAVLLVAILGGGQGAPAAPRTPGPSQPFVPDEILVKFRADVSVNPQVFARSIGASVGGSVDALGVHVFKIPAGTVERTVQMLSRHPLVEYAEPNGIAHAVGTPSDPLYSQQWAWPKVSAPQAWDLTTGSETVRCAIVDTGVGPHEDLPGLAAQRDFVNNDNNASDDNGHGTHVAGTVAALANNGTGGVGANWSVALVAAKVLSASGSGTYAAVANGITWSADQGAWCINISLGGYWPSNTLKNAVNYAWNKGAVLACAAGNDGMNWKLYPAAYDRCIAVAASDQNDTKAWFSNYGASWVDVVAPGVGILSTVLNNGYEAWGGTSMATPHVAGLAGLVWARALARNTCTTASCVRTRIEQNTDAVPGVGTYYKYGRVNYFKAVNF